MPITKSAKKALRQNLKRKKRNSIYKQRMKELFKEIKRLVATQEKEAAGKLLPDYYKAVDKAAKSNVIKENAASRKKASLTKLVNQIEIKETK
jgi:small subunit ribosomal protein S20